MLEALGAIEATARGGMRELRRILVLLRADDDPVALGPQPGLGDLTELVDRSRGAGLRVALRVGGRPRPLGDGLEVCAHRIVQEALTNVRRHAGPADVRVLVDYGEHALVVEVTDTGTTGTGTDGTAPGADPGPGGRTVPPDRAPVPAPRPPGGGTDGAVGAGQGLIGMRERVALFGGRLDVGPVAGGWRVAARILLADAAVPSAGDR